jgi:hypothetical protein
MQAMKERTEDTTLVNRMFTLEQELKLIQQRNARVEADKAWETSGTRIVSICCLTYVVAGVLLYLLGTENCLLNALIPTCGFFLSSQSLPAIKRWWISTHLQKDPANQ